MQLQSSDWLNAAGPVYRPRRGHRIEGQTVRSSLSHTHSSISFTKECPCNKRHIYSKWRRHLQALLNVWFFRVDLVGLTNKSKQKLSLTLSCTQCSSDRQLHWVLRRPENFAKTIGHFRNLHRRSESERGWKKCWRRIQFSLWHVYGINYSDSGGAHIESNGLKLSYCCIVFSGPPIPLHIILQFTEQAR